MAMTYTTQSSSSTLTREKMVEIIRTFNARLNGITPLDRSHAMSPIIESPHMVKCVQFRFPRCKSRRIARKWNKRPSNFRTVPMDHVYITSMGIIAHPGVARRIRRVFT